MIKTFCREWETIFFFYEKKYMDILELKSKELKRWI